MAMKKSFKKLFASLFTTSLFFTPIQTTQAQEIDAIQKIFSYAVAEDPQNNIAGLHLYKIDTSGVATLLEADLFPDGGPETFDAGGLGIDNINGKLYFREPPRGDGSNVLRVRVFDVKTETITGWMEISGLGDGAQPIFVPKPDLSAEKIEKKCTSSDGSTCSATDEKSISLGGSDMDVTIDTQGVNIDGESVFTKNSDGSIQIGADGNDIDITSEGLSIDGSPMISKQSDGNIHIGKNSLITPIDYSTLSDGRKVHHLWAEDDTNTKIPINIYGSDLLINGVSVQGQIDDNATNILINTAKISTNKANIKNLGEGVAGSTALTAALSALPQTSKESKLSCGVGTGGYSSRYAVGFGCASQLNERVDVNAGGSYVFGGSKSYGGGTLDSGVIKAGFVFKLGEINKNTQISMIEKENFETKIKTLEEKNNELLARLERLEKVALGDLKSKDLAVSRLK